MDESTVPRWQRVWAQLPREVRGQLINLVLLGLLVGSFLLVYVTAMLFLGGARVVEWLQEQPSPYTVMDDRYFTHCLDQVEALHQAAVELQRRENTRVWPATAPMPAGIRDLCVSSATVRAVIGRGRACRRVRWTGCRIWA